MSEEQQENPVAEGDSQASAMALERCLKVGMDVFLDASPGTPNSPRYPAKLRGWERGHYILLAAAAGVAAPVIRQGKECVIRFMHEGEVWGFGAIFAEQGLNSGYPLLQFYWPREVARVQVRKHERVRVETPCTVELENGETYRATIGDLSGGGCSILVACELDTGAPLRLSFRMPDGGQVSRRPVVVRNRRVVRGQGFQYGCQFQAWDDKDHGIQLFVARKIAIGRGETAPHPQVLVLSRNELDLEQVQQALAAQPYEIIEAAGILDLGYRLRLCKAAGILISAEQRELSCSEVLSLIRQSPGTESIAMFVYGGGPGLHAQASAAGATLCLNDLSEVPRILPHLPQPAPPSAPPESPPESATESGREQPADSGEGAQASGRDEDDEIVLEEPA